MNLFTRTYIGELEFGQFWIKLFVKGADIPYLLTNVDLKTTFPSKTNIIKQLRG